MLKFPTDLRYVKKASEKVLSLLENLHLDESTLFDIKLCFEEAFINAVKYGNKYDSNLSVDVEVIVQDGRVEIAVFDHGKGFDAKTAQDPTKKEFLSRTSGRGVFLIKNLMDEVNFANNGSCVRMIKKLGKHTGG